VLQLCEKRARAAYAMFQSPRTYLRRLVVNYGEHFCVLLCSVYGGLKGPVFQMMTSAQLPYFKSIGITGQQYQSYGTVASTPWAMKAAIGITSDAMPLWGWHKRPYILIGSGSFSRRPSPLCSQLLCFCGKTRLVIISLSPSTGPDKHW
jgi:hypothetical protein